MVIPQEKSELFKRVLELSPQELAKDTLEWVQAEPEVAGYGACLRAFFSQNLAVLEHHVRALDPKSCAFALASAWCAVLDPKRLDAEIQALQSLSVADPTWFAEKEYVRATLLRVQGNSAAAARAFRDASRALARVGVEKKSLRALLWAFDCELKLARDPKTLMVDYFFAARKLKKLGETKAATVALKRLLGELGLEGADLVHRELSALVGPTDLEAELQLPDGMSELEIRLVRILAQGALERIDLITRMYPDEPEFESAESRLKVFLSRFRKKYPDWILREGGKYRINAPLLARLRSGGKRAA